MGLYDALSKIAAHVKIQRPLIANEDDTILVSIQPFVRAIGYDTQNLAEFKAQFSADAKTTGGEKVDYAILRDGKPVIFIEVKDANIKLNESHWKQLYNYFNAQDVRFAILTNGIEYRFYTDLNKSHIMDKVPFLTIDMLNLDERKVRELEGFTRSGYDPERIIADAQRRVMARLLRNEMEKPSDELVKLFARQVQSGRLGPADVQHYSRLLTEAWREQVSERIADPIDPPPPPCNDIPVYGYYEGHRFEAELLRKSIKDGLTIAGHQVRYNGETTGLKDAAAKAIRSVNPSFEPTKTYPNGFQFWHVVDPDGGKEHAIRYISGWDNITDEALRERILST